jgi:TetR/AcrR family transcriptional regulator, fatty acid metabolism regulator protein
MHSKNSTSDQNNASDRSFIDLARREQIIRSAIETIAELGYGGTSFARIAKRAKTSIGVISYHFAGKDELINQIVISIYAAGAKFMLPKIQTQKNASAALRAYIETNIEFIAKHPLEMLALAQILPNFRDEDGKLHYDHTKEEPVIASLEDLLSWGQKTGEFRSFERRVMAITIRRAIDGFPMQIATCPGLNVAEYARELATLFEMATRM